MFRLSFDAKEVKGKREINKILDYIHYNPVSGKWNLVIDFIEYEHSSAGYYESGEHGKVIINHYLDAMEFSEFPSDNSEGD